MTEAENKLRSNAAKALERDLYEYLLEHVARQKALFPDMDFDLDEGTAFVLVTFNHNVSGAKQNDDATAHDVACSIASSSYTIMPYVEPAEDGSIGSTECMPHGVHAVAAVMMSAIMRNNGLPHVMSVAQQAISQQRNLTND